LGDSVTGTTKNEEMNDGNFAFFCHHSKSFLREFLRSIKIFHMGPDFLLCYDENFYFIFLMQVMKVNMQCKKVNMDNYRVTSRRGSRIFMSTEPDFSAVHSLGASSDPGDDSPDD
jgi:hypothetical protein